MAYTKLTVFFKHSGEHIDVPVCVESTVGDIIKYVCKNSVIRAKINYDDYYLNVPNTHEILANDETLEQINVPTEEKVQFQLCMKSALRQRILLLALQKSHAVQDARSVNPPIPVESIESNEMPDYNEKPSSGSQDCDSNDVVPNQCQSQSRVRKRPAPAPPLAPTLLLEDKVQDLGTSEFVSATTTMGIETSNPSSPLPSTVQSTQENAILSEPGTIPSDHLENANLPAKLAHTYQHVTSMIDEIASGATRNLVLRQQISTILEEINIVLCGSPRVGKSTLINALCRREVARTSPGLDSCTSTMSCYRLTGQSETESGAISYKYNFWDTPGFKSWTQKDIRQQLEAILRKPKSGILCMVYCASPGSHANREQLNWLLNECMKRNIFCALVCTNKWVGHKSQRDVVMEDFQNLLTSYHSKTREENGVIYFGKKGLCTLVNSERYVDTEGGKTFEQAGINELILGIMESIDDEKIVQWCALVSENKSFWNSIFKFPKQFRPILERLRLKK